MTKSASGAAIEAAATRAKGHKTKAAKKRRRKDRDRQQADQANYEARLEAGPELVKTNKDQKSGNEQ